MVGLPSLYQEVVHISRYSKWIPEESRRETWEETVKRYFDFFETHLKENCNYELSKTMRKELEDGVLNLEVMPSMRCLMTAGKALEKNNAAAYNCVSGDTKILTYEMGLVPIKDVTGEATVLNSNKEWVPATIRNFGKQKLYKITLNYYKSRVVLRTTGDHNWVVAGERVSTTQLKHGDIIPFVSVNRKANYDTIDYKLGLIHGLIYGDGTATKYKRTPQDKLICAQERIRGYHIRLCGDSKELLSIFDNYPVTYPPSFNGDPVVMLYDNFAKTHLLKELPNEMETEDYLVGFFRGWIAADGYVSKTVGQVVLCCGPEEELWIKRVLAKVGYYTLTSTPLPEKSNFGQRKKASVNLRLHRPSLTKDDFILKRKKENFKCPEFKGYSVASIEETDESEEVYCATVNSTHDFVIENGILTGNCSYVSVDSPRAFDEAMYLLMLGCGVGFSVERQYISQLPIVPDELYDTDTTIVVDDSKIGWAKSFKELLGMLYLGQVPKWDLSKIRPAGELLKTFGGRAAGPEPLNKLFKFAVQLFKNARGRKLQSIECHDLMCMVGEIVISGGKRRSATISLSNVSDDRMRDAKSGQWWIENPHRSLANNSACHTEKPGIGVFLKEWLALYSSRSGERGIFNLAGAKKHIKERVERRDQNKIQGLNPCGEVLLRSMSFCNLSEVVIRHSDKKEDIKRKIRLAAILGTFQSTLTDFKYLRKDWRKNCEEERLLGVSLTGIMDNRFTSTPSKELEEFLVELKTEVLRVNAKLSAKLGIDESKSCTVIKPSGTVSSLVDSSSGIHPRHSRYYIRTIRMDIKDPMCQLMIDCNIPHEPDCMNPATMVFSFPLKSPDTSTLRNELNAIQQLELYLVYKKFYTEHSVSVTINVKEAEWIDVAAFVYSHFDEINGVSFLPYSDSTYKQMPYQECTKEEYDLAASKMPKEIDWNKMKEYEKEDNTTSSREFSCTGNHCDLA